MSHKFEFQGVIFNCNSDYSGDVRIAHNGKSVEVPVAALFDFMLERKARAIISAIEDGDPEMIEELSATLRRIRRERDDL